MKEQQAQTPLTRLISGSPVPAWTVLLVGGVLNLPFFLHSLYFWLRGGSRLDDSWGPMQQAYHWFAGPHTGTIYQHIFFAEHVKFQYPPSSLLLFSAADLLHLHWSIAALNVVSWLFVGVEAAAVATLARVLMRRQGWTPANRALLWFLPLLAAMLSIAFYPVIRGYTLGQVQTWLNAWFALACLCWLHERRMAAGALIGLICLFKPQLGLFLIWAALRRQKRFLIGWAAVVVPCELASLTIFGWANHLDYLAALRFMAHHGEFVYPNQSVNGLLNRIAGNVSVGNTFPAYIPWVYAITLLSSAALILAAMLYRARSHSTNLMDFLIAGLSFTMASPIAWGHHYGILPAFYVILLAVILRIPDSPYRNKLLLVLAISYILTATPLYPNFFPYTGWESLGQSTILFGALGTLWLLYKLRDGAGLIGEAAATLSRESA